METHIFASEIGNIKLFYDADKLYEIIRTEEAISKNEPTIEISDFIDQFRHYLKGYDVKFKINFEFTGTSFNKAVLREIFKIKYGELITYKELARRSGFDKAYRAVGTVCKNNKLPILIPCHRVINSNGHFGQYSLGKEIKAKLIDIEDNTEKY